MERGHLERTNQAALETLWTAEQALEWAKKRSRWPSRRFRLEGTGAGNSRLVTKATATQLRGRYGGQVVELIPEPPPRKRPPKDPADRKPSKNQERAAFMPACTKCGAAAGKPCTTPTKPVVLNGAALETKPAIRPPHRDRVIAHEAIMAARAEAIAPAISAG